MAFVASSMGAVLPGTPGKAGAGLLGETWRLDVATHALTRLTNFKEDEPYSAWTGDGTMLIALGAGGLYEICPDGSQGRRIGEGSFDGQADVR